MSNNIKENLLKGLNVLAPFVLTFWAILKILSYIVSLIRFIFPFDFLLKSVFE